MGIVGAEIAAVVAEEALEADPDVGLDVLDQVPDVDRAVGVGEGGGDEDLAQDDSCPISKLNRERRIDR